MFLFHQFGGRGRRDTDNSMGLQLRTALFFIGVQIWT